MKSFSTTRPVDNKTQVGGIEDLPANLKTGNQFPLELRVHGLRVLTGTFLMVAVMVSVTAFFFQSVKITTVNTSHLSDKERLQILDDYNWYSGSIVSVVSIPFQQFPSMLLPVFFLYFTTHAVLAENKSFVMERGPVISLAVVSYMIGLGLSSLNVQFGSPRLEYCIVASDLVEPEVDTSNFTDFNYITSITHIAGVPSTDTILRSAIVPLMETSETTCTDAMDKYYRKPEASIEFGFPLNSWLDSLLPQSIASNTSFKFSMSDDINERQVNASQLPNGDVRKTAVLLTSAFTTMFAQFVSDGDTYIFNYHDNLGPILDEDMNSPDAVSLLTNVQNTITNDLLVSNIFDTNVSKWTFWDSIETSEITIELSSFELSPQVSFEAVTFDLPVKTDVMDSWMSDQGWIKDGATQTHKGALCSDLGCIVTVPNLAGRNQDQVRLVPLCAGENEWGTDRLIYPGKCKTVSNSSVLVLSIAQNFATDEDDEVNLDFEYSEQVWIMNVNNPRTTFRVTVGRLAWTVDDLASIYGSECAEGVNCRGLHFPLADGKRHVLVGEEHIPVPQNSTFTDPPQWQTLVKANTQVNDAVKGYVVAYHFPPYRVAMWNKTKLSDVSCSTQAKNFVSDVIERHMYSKDPVQPAYTAALFWLFHHAAVKQIVTTEASNSTGVQLKFDGNRSWTDVQAAIPFKSACTTFAGCGILLVLGLLVAWRSRNQQRQASLSNHIAAYNISAVLADSRQFPPLLVSVGVKQQSKTNKPQIDSSTAFNPIDRFEIIQTTIILRDRLDKSEHKVIIGGGIHSIPDEATEIENSLVVSIKDTE